MIVYMHANYVHFALVLLLCDMFESHGYDLVTDCYWLEKNT